MNKVNDIEVRVKNLTLDELRSFRDWFTEFDAEVWDQQLAADVRAGKLDKLADQALRDYQASRSTEL